ncbi:vesicular inhibitory amino acid transporter-like [Porites lutea]|uniref:vesicular inhibitory amino acid transporter-like n=1 Tax=Porites lutea TaxID=51062 RepID=UPI003CC5CDC9
MKQGYRNLPPVSESDEETVLELQSSDAESSSDDESVSSENYIETESAASLPEGTCSTWKATMNLLNYIEGVGLLAMSYSIKKGGITAVISLFLLPIITWYAGKVLAESLYESDDKKGKIRVRSTWKEIGDAIYPKYAGKIVAWNQDIGFVVVAVSYLILCGSLTSHALPTVPLSQTSWTCFAALLILPTMFLKSYSQIAWLSTISIVAIGLTTAITVWYGVKNIENWDPSTLLFWDFEGVFISLGIALSSYDVSEIIPSVEKSMKNKSDFGKALASALAVSVVIKVIIAVFGFLTFGSKTDEAIVNNFPVGPLNITASISLVISSLLSIILCLRPVCESLDESTFFSEITSDISNTIRNIIIRVSLVVITLAIAIFLPHYALIAALMGSFQTVFSAFWIPLLVHLKAKYHELSRLRICADVTLLVFTSACSVLGIYFSIKGLIQAGLNSF